MPLLASTVEGNSYRNRFFAKLHSYIESVGVYLPERIESSRKIVSECVNTVRIPLERITGIKNRRRAGIDEWSYDLAVHAVKDCVRKSRYHFQDIDLIICCNISKQDGPKHRFSIEPSTAQRLKAHFGLHHALAFDVNNACAGMFTGVYIADSMIRGNNIQRALVVSGEYITHLIDTAQKEINHFSDGCLACLTLGDSGAALLLDKTSNRDVGFLDMDMLTVPRYSDLCIARPTFRPHGGAIMHTRSQDLFTCAIYHSTRHTKHFLKKNELKAGDIHYFVPHQVAKEAFKVYLHEFNKLSKEDKLDKHVFLKNYQEMGNTATTTHTLALYQSILDGNIHEGQKALFSITASGLTIGTAVYQFDNLGERIRSYLENNKPPPKVQHSVAPAPQIFHDHPLIAISNLSFQTAREKTSTRVMSSVAGKDCFSKSRFNIKDADMILSVGVHNTGYIAEPSNAALIADLLHLDHDLPSDDYTQKTFTFDLTNGALGWLSAVFVLHAFMQTGKIRCALLIASEAENNKVLEQKYPLRNLKECASACILHRSPGKEGFSHFFFESHDQHLHEYDSYFEISTEHAIQFMRHGEDYLALLINCLNESLKKYLLLRRSSLDDFDFILCSQISPEFTEQLLFLFEKFSKDSSKRFVYSEKETKDLYTSSMVAALDIVLGVSKREDLKGKKALLLNVTAGIQVGIAQYQF